MSYVPLTIASYCATKHPHVGDVLKNHGQLIGIRPEVNLTTLREVNPSAAQTLETFYSNTMRIWDAFTRGDPSGPYQLTKRILVTHKQRNSKADRADLPDVYAALLEVPALRDVTLALTDKHPSETLETLIRDIEGTVTQTGDTTMSATVPLQGQVTWPEVLGGVPWPTEVEREVTIETNWAAWRDRRIRRLTSVTVTVTEVFALH